MATSRNRKSKQRPHFSAGIAELERLVDLHRNDHDTLSTLLDELAYRSTARSASLRSRVIQRLGTQLTDGGQTTEPRQRVRESRSTKAGNGDPPSWSDHTAAAVPQIEQERAETHLPSAPDDDFWGAPIEAEEDVGTADQESEISDKPVAILDAWTALEVLSPQAFNRPEDLADGDRRRIADFGHGLPWQGQGEKARPRRRLFYHVVLGALRLDLATASLLKAFGDQRPERPRSKSLAALAIVTVDQKGRPVDDNPVVVASFGFGYRQVRKGKLETLKDWPEIEQRLVDRLRSRLVVHDDGEIQPLTLRQITDAAEWLANGFDIPSDQRVPPGFAVRVYHWIGAPNPPEPTLLNSFFLDDLGKSRSLVATGDVGKALRRYLTIDKPPDQVDLLDDKEALRALLSPQRMPKARWPSRGLHSLVLLQQAAVNLTFAELEESGIASVNGPPGTGKTTLLRDIVSGIVYTRAQSMISFDDPETAFSHRGNVRRGNAFLHLYEIDQSLCGHEILVASSNNAAVENVSKELPARDAIEGKRAPDYFPSIADAVNGSDDSAWGLAAAVLGNAANRMSFYKSFWKDEDRGLRQYLRACSGKETKISKSDPKPGEEIDVTPQVVLRERPPKNREEALRRWRRARKAFQATALKTEERLKGLSAVRDLIGKIDALRRQARLSETSFEASKTDHQTAVQTLTTAEEEAESAKAFYDSSRSELRDHALSKPGFFSYLFQTAAWKSWRQINSELLSSLERCLKRKKAAEEALVSTRETARRAEIHLNHAQKERDRDREALDHADEALSASRHQLGSRFADEAYWAAEHKKRQASVAWLDDETQALRDRCFAAAFDVHRAFIAAAAKPLRNNLGVFFGVILGTRLAEDKRPLLPSLWSSLFFVTPVVSTTFASVGRMLASMPPESIGWLLIDEAGQALPQAAAGAMLRAKRSLVVGDPLQIKPVVTLPPSLTDKVCRRFGVNPDTWSAPTASIQTLADRVSRHSSWIEQMEGAVRVGAPLLVHRRCEEPMFGISNTISYAGQMVNATRDRPSPIREVLGPSRWIDIRGGVQGKWCPDEGERVIDMLQALADAGLEQPDIFCITPFRVVTQRLRERLQRQPGLLEKLSDAPHKWAYDRIGTVHTFQGKEAEAVVLVLGCQDESQTGARRWAGSPANLANVSVSRAKQALYVVGNRTLWRNAGSLREISNRLPVCSDDPSSWRQ